MNRQPTRLISFFVVSIFAWLFFIPRFTHADCISDWLTQNPAGGSVTAEELSDIECVFGYFEASFPSVFYPASTTVWTGPLAYRYYAGTQAFLAAWKTTSLKLMYLGPLSANCFMELGTVDFWRTLVCFANPVVTPGLWAGSNVQFFVSSDGARITTIGSSIIKGGVPYSFVLGPVSIDNVGFCGNIHLTINTSGDDIPIVNNSFQFSTIEGMSISGSFGSSSRASGTYAIYEYVPFCAGYAVGSGAWSASPPALYGAEAIDRSKTGDIVMDNLIREVRNP